jgi:hypothetical protein
MKAALALIFFACIAGSMASDARAIDLQNIIGQGQVVVQALLGNLQQQILGLVQQAVGQLSSLLGSLGRFDFNAILNQLTSQFKPLLEQLAGQALGSILGGLQGILGGSRVDIPAILSGFLQQIQGALTGIGQHFLNEGLAAVLGGLGSLGGRGIFDDIWTTLQGHINTAVTTTQTLLGGALGNLSALGSTLLDASKPHLEQLQEQLIGHGLNVLGSLSETINNLHGTITGGR